MKPYHHLSGYRSIDIMYEKRHSFNHTELIRSKRRHKCLPNVYDDEKQFGWYNNYIPWKKLRNKQYRSKGSKNKEHIIVINYNNYSIYRIKEYFRKQDIPYKMTFLKDMREVRRAKWRGYYEWGYDITGRYKNLYRVVKDGYETIMVNFSTELEIKWWSNKDIGIDYILKRNLTYMKIYYRV